MTPYYQDEYVTLYHGDCREVLPSLPRHDLLLTDPPYGIGRDGQRMSFGAHGGRKEHKSFGWDAMRPSQADFFLLLRSAERHIIWGGNYFADLLPPSPRWLVWDKGQRISQSDGELAWTSLPGVALRIFTLNRASLLTDVSVHPTQKPLDLISWCLSLDENTTSLLDPYVGSGTVLRAAKDRRIRCIGIERQEEYCEIASDRCRQEVLSF